METHPDFSRRFSANFYLDDDNEFAPFGSDEGADVLTELRCRPADVIAGTTLRRLLGDDAAELLANAESGHPDVGLLSVLVAYGFGLLRFTGAIDDEGRDVLLRALTVLRHRYGDVDELVQMTVDLGGPTPSDSTSASAASAPAAPLSRRDHPWLALFTNVEDLRLQPWVDWSWVRARKRPYIEKVDWIRRQIAPFPDAGSAIPPETAWSRWWDTGVDTTTELWCFLDVEPGAQGRIRVNRRPLQQSVRTRARLDLGCLDGPADVVAATAREHVWQALYATAATLGLSEPPLLPLTRRERTSSAPDPTDPS